MAARSSPFASWPLSIPFQEKHFFLIVPTKVMCQCLMSSACPGLGYVSTHEPDPVVRKI